MKVIYFVYQISGLIEFSLQFEVAANHQQYT